MRDTKKLTQWITVSQANSISQNYTDDYRTI